MNKQEYEQLIEKLNYYTKKYDEGNPEITDKEWDDLYFEAVQFEKETGYVSEKSPSSTIQYDVQTSLKKVTHNHPMLSLSKTKDINYLNSWITEPTIVMLKMDGLTCSLTYKNGKLVQAETRGNGKVGEDITLNAMTLKSIPKTIPTKETVVVDGEVICTFSDFKYFEDEFKNPRNFASGSIKLLNTKEVSRRRLTFVAWDFISSNKNLDEKLDDLKTLGFVIVPYEIVDIHHIEEQQDRMKEKANDYPIDGLVYKINNKKSYDAKGTTEHSPIGGLAFKFSDEEYETRLIDIDWQVGKTGKITPIAVYEPVDYDGTILQRASMHNLTIMRELLGDHPHVGQKIWIIRANQVIPQIVRAEKEVHNG